MVKICNLTYPKENNTKYIQYHEKYPYTLHDFQKWSIEAIVTGNHVLVCCPTGSGKTFSGEFALDYFHSKGKKTIYTTPIKALSNEKFYNFTKKYPHINVGIITGDIRCNPDADVLIMTTEILLNKLYQIYSGTTVPNSAVSFEMDIEHELGCVVFDEIHFILEESRGHVWEQCIMMLPHYVQMIGLSATLDDPEKFAYWLETKGQPQKPGDKEVFLAKKQIRAVPLIHYSFITVTNTFNKTIKDKATQEIIKKAINKPFVIQDEKGTFNDIQYQSNSKILNLFNKNNIYVKRQHILNKVAEYLVENEMLPALCYVFSRKQIEKCAEELTTNLLEFDSKIPYTVDRECEQIIRKLPNYEEYLHLPEYINTVKLLRKGVGIHHAGLMPILREMTELLFARGFIKFLFCTETMSVGINLPVKTTIFTDINKFNGEIMRPLYSHEYTQAAGRAGRLGLDSVGHVIHLTNLLKNTDSVTIKNMMKGKPQSLVSRFKISYNLLLNLIDIGETDYTKYAKRSMIQGDIESQTKICIDNINKLTKEIDDMNIVLECSKIPINIVNEYIELKQKIVVSVNKKRKEAEKSIKTILDEYPFIEKDVKTVTDYNLKQNELKVLNLELISTQKILETSVNTVLQLLEEESFITSLEGYKLTTKGQIACQLREIHCLIFANIFDKNKLRHFDAKLLVGILSCFTNISVPEDKRNIFPNSSKTNINDCVKEICDMYVSYQQLENFKNINTGIDYTLHFDLIDYVIEWCDCENDLECKQVLNKLSLEKDVFLGEFVKAILKINNIASEMEKVSELLGDVEFLHTLNQIPQLTLKYVATNQSLYV